MNRYLPLVLIAFGILAFATLMLVIAPGIQMAQHTVPEGLHPYSKQEQRGRDQYVSLGCVYCHSQQPRAPEHAPDVERGWGRPSVSADYVFDQPHQLGTMRTGPDLLNVGARLASESWHLTHLYQPRAIFDWSIMPAYPYLFEEKAEAGPEDTVVVLPEGFGPDSGVVVARQEALDLAAYLLALDRTYPVPEDALRDDGYARTEGGS